MGNVTTDAVRTGDSASTACDNKSDGYNRNLIAAASDPSFTVRVRNSLKLHRNMDFSELCSAKVVRLYAA
jgi:hypothetical protein